MIPLFKVFMSQDAAKEVGETLNSGMITQNKKVEEYETSLKKWFGHDLILSLNSATSGLTLAFRLLNLKAGDEVLSTPLTCMATNLPILANNLKIRWVDVDPNTCNIDLKDLKSKISKKTRAVCFVHWGGSPVDLDEIENIKKYAKDTFGTDLKIIEDCAHAFGAEYNNKKIGTHGNIAVFSTQAIKHLTTGDGGLIFLPNRELYDRAKLLRWYGISREKRSGADKDFRLEDDVVEWGYKFHMNDINATIGLSNLPHIQSNLEKHRINADYFKRNLRTVDGVTLLKHVKNSVSSYWIYTIKIINKNQFITFMKDNDVVVSQVHNRNDIHTCLKEFKSNLPQLNKLENEIVSIPVGWWVTRENLDTIIGLIKQWCKLNCPYQFKKLTIDDWAVYLELLNDGFNIKSYFEYTKDKFKENLIKIQNQNSEIILIQADDNIIGSGKFFIENKFYDNVAHIEDIVIHKDYRRQGVAKYLIEYIIKQIPPTCYKIILQCHPSIGSLYADTGFVHENNGYVLRL